ncbi:hypothetical protein ARALYDRAFT_916775 [Arabidopsis lyrata subsp. lyrata]|uniref:Uncharacterized protein n=1 Tax=Arabidopsis lyrata subsp. lyrata TaxID=81972 RepID=D7MRD2_ARALL|nr:hypothetical protein ARALYDRAFT_916775 [Arabidopsis lyrata subsp. lyrata]
MVALLTLVIHKAEQLHMAAANGHMTIVEYLISEGWCERTPMDETIGAEKIETIDAINTTVAQIELENIRVT